MTCKLAIAKPFLFALLVAGCGLNGESTKNQLASTPDKPCSDRPGAAKDWEGFLCNGNIQLFVPLSVAQVGLVYNSLDASYQEGFGFGWRLNVRSILETDGNDKVTIYRPGGTPFLYRFDGSSWNAEPLNTSRLSYDPQDFFTETLIGGTRLVYRPSPGGRYYLQQVVDRNGNSITIQRNGQDRETSLTDAKGLVTTFHWDASRLQAVEDPEGRTFTLQHTQDGELESVTYPTVDAGRPVERFLYDANGRHLLIARISPGGMITDFGYYDDGSLKALVGPSRRGMLVEYTENSVIQRYSLGEEIVQQFENGELIEVGTELGMLVQYERDNRHRVTRISNRLNHAWELGYNANDDIVWEQNPLGDVAIFEYDDNHNPVSASRHSLAWTYGWNQFNQITAVTNPLGETTSYQRDASGNLTRLVDFSGRTLLQATFNPDGTLRSLTDRYGETISFEYDEHGNVKAVEHPAVGSVALNSSPTGLLRQKASALGETTLTHDDRAALVELAVRANRKGGGEGLRIMLTRDLDNRVVGRIVCGPGGCSTSSKEFGPTGNVAKSEQNGETVQDGECPCVVEQAP